MQFSAIALSASAFFSASLAAKLQMRAGDCSTDSVKCCNQVKDASSIDTGTLGLLGIDELAGQVGLECDQIAAVVGVPISNQCKTTAACCSDQTQNGLANLGCVPISAI
ncbi:Fruiting body protein SC3 [Wallemia ichthyophaga EXF-994]|uniref:Hydrophobin n=1 Tax=Wallemia ichthyophaga (strain EXF-994 / CBS 113033) TaxID=1299270 RepID=R9AB72_WALI9|nr:Fruiting body protein SC3 [Wallemia ichthyophaga EXF-994]EOQ99294.1 Fruiting body protein SC3 [Wallemia ichthyophaga EXF-994]